MISREETSGKINIVSFLVVAGIMLISFIVFYTFYMPIDFNNLGGKHAWVSASTIKYVNMWLSEGTGNLHFTNYEYYPSIEFASLSERMPYVSYPTGVTFMVWLGAKICGISHIDISFLKHFQLVMYAIECTIMGEIAYLICVNTVKARECVKVIIASIVGLFWMSLPVNNWFLSNIYWTDIAVILWVLALLLLEGLSDTEYITGKAHTTILILKALIIVAGVLTEYYFWIVVFVAFALNIAREYFGNKSKIKDVIISGLQYVIPVFVGLIIYIVQMSTVAGWQEQLLETFVHRTGASDNGEASASMFITNFKEAIVCGSSSRLLLLIVAECTIAGLCIWMVIRKARSVDEKHKPLLKNKFLSVIYIMIFTPIIQLLIFSNHSAIHQYAMVKYGLHLTGMILLLIWCVGAVNFNHVIDRILGMVVILAMLLAMGYPGQTKKYYYEKYDTSDYSIAEAVRDNTDYEDVCFSFTYQAVYNPPMNLCVSEKAVYLIDDISETNSMFDLPSNARKLLVIDKNSQISSKEQDALDDSSVIYEDEACVIAQIDV